MEKTKIDKYTYILFHPQSGMVFYGFHEPDMFGYDMALCYSTSTLSAIREVKKQVLEEFGIDCTILKYSVLEVE